MENNQFQLFILRLLGEIFPLNRQLYADVRPKASGKLLLYRQVRKVANILRLYFSRIITSFYLILRY